MNDSGSRRLGRARSVLFAPADKQRLLDKLIVSGADVVVADLEDGVAADDHSKDAARQVLSEWLENAGRSDGEPVFLVRVNPLGTAWFEEDVRLTRFERVDGVVLPKAEERVGELRSRLDDVRSLGILAGVETVRGVHGVERLTQSGAVDALYFGAEDYITDIGGRRTHLGAEVLYARSRVVMAARLGNITAIDQIVADYRDDELFLADAMVGRDLGYDGKLCIHPSQVALAHGIFSPSAEEVAWAARVVEAAHEAAAAGRGVVSVDGRMIDAPLIARAERVLADRPQTFEEIEEDIGG